MDDELLRKIVDSVKPLAVAMGDFVKFKPSQPRVPGGSTHGGEWTDSGGGGGSGGGGSSAKPSGGGSLSQAGWEKSLSASQRSAIDAYTGGDYGDIRGCQNQSSGCTEKIKGQISDISEAMKSAPKVSGEVYRGLSFKYEDDAAQFIARVKKKGTLDDKGFLSTSSDRDVARDFATADTVGVGVVMKIRSKSGVSVKNISMADEEAEVMMPIGAKLKYKSASRDSSGVFILTMEEV